MLQVRRQRSRGAGVHGGGQSEALLPVRPVRALQHGLPGAAVLPMPAAGAHRPGLPHQLQQVRLQNRSTTEFMLWSVDRLLATPRSIVLLGRSYSPSTLEHSLQRCRIASIVFPSGIEHMLACAILCHQLTRSSRCRIYLVNMPRITNTT